LAQNFAVAEINMTKNMGARQRSNRRSRGMVNAEEAEKILGKTRRTICRWEKEGRMPTAVKLPPPGRLRLYRLTDIEEMARDARSSSQSSQQ
jgi:predicted DNA-binding transcriptional regulator AlpA